MDLQGKKILFIGIGFYDYENAISDVLSNRGAVVNHFSSSYVSFWAKVVNRFKLTGLYRKMRTRYIRQQIELHPNNDIVFVIKGENLYQPEIELLKTKNPVAQFVLYLWDSLVRQDNSALLLSSFDSVWSFDRKDCQANPKLRFRPLFYRSLPEKREKIYELSFIGWIHSDRLEMLRKLKQQLQAQGKPYFMKLYVGRVEYLMWRYITHLLTRSDDDLIITQPIGYSDFQRVGASSRAILDLAHPQQNGLTMRTIETLAAGCHLLTTNQDIVNYADIPQGCYTIFDRQTPNLPNISSESHCGIGDNYSLDSFVDQIFAS